MGDVEVQERIIVEALEIASRSLERAAASRRRGDGDMAEKDLWLAMVALEQALSAQRIRNT